MLGNSISMLRESINLRVGKIVLVEIGDLLEELQTFFYMVISSTLWDQRYAWAPL